MTREQFWKMRWYQSEFEDMPDGAFFAMAEDTYGIDHDDWIEFYDLEKAEEKKEKKQ